MLFAILFGFLTQIFFKRKYHRIFYSFAFVLFIITGVMPSGEYMFHLLEKKYHSKNYLPKKVDGILILSGTINTFLTKEYGQISLNGASERLIESIKLIKAYPSAKIIFSGCSSSLLNQKDCASYIAEEFYKMLEIKSDNFIFESKARNTFENLVYSKELAQPKLNENWIIVTSAFHMHRAIEISKKLEWKLYPYAVDYQFSKKFSWKPETDFVNNIGIFYHGSREWVGLIFYKLTGRINNIY